MHALTVQDSPVQQIHTLLHCKNVKSFQPCWVTSVASVERFLQCACKGHFNPCWVLSVADVSIMAQLANLN